MSNELSVRIILQSPTAGVDFGIQKGSGNKYETILKQRSSEKDLVFEFTISVKDGKTSSYNFTGQYVHGPANERFIYVDIGTAAGQINSVWTRRLKVPLRDIPPATINQLLADPSLLLETKVPGTGK